MTMSRSEAGRKGAEALNKDPQKKSAAAQKAAQTRGHESFVEMGRKGGQSSHGGGRQASSGSSNRSQSGRGNTEE